MGLKETQNIQFEEKGNTRKLSVEDRACAERVEETGEMPDPHWNKRRVPSGQDPTLLSFQLERKRPREFYKCCCKCNSWRLGFISRQPDLVVSSMWYWL